MRFAASTLLLGIFAAGILWIGFVLRRFSPEPAWADASGYFNSAALLSSGKLTATLRVPSTIGWYYPYDLEPIGFHFDRSRSVLVPTYFVGLPILLAAAHILVGWHVASFIVIFGSAVLFLVCSYLMLRAIGIDWQLSMAATISAAWCPIFDFTSSQTYSDTIASLGCAVAALCILRGPSKNSVLPLISGMVVGFALFVRSTDFLILPSLLLLTASWRDRVAIGVGCLPFLAALVGYQFLTYGNGLVSGYGHVIWQFDWRYFPRSLVNYSTVFPRLLPLVLLAPIGAFWPAACLSRRLQLGLAVWVAAFVVFYSFYFFTGRDWADLRFIEPTFPALLGLACMAVEAFAARFDSALLRTRFRSAAAHILLAATACVAFFAHFADPRLHDRGFVAAQAWMKQRLPPNSLVVCEIFSGPIYFETPNPILRWDITAKENIRKYLWKMWDSGTPVYSLLDESELSNAELRKKVPGHWEKVADFATASAWRIDRPAIRASACD
jgi:hypothetical protein